MSSNSTHTQLNDCQLDLKWHSNGIQLIFADFNNIQMEKKPGNCTFTIRSSRADVLIIVMLTTRVQAITEEKKCSGCF